MLLPDLLNPMRFTPDSDDKYKLATGDRMRGYQLRAAHKIFCGEPVRNPATGVKEGPARDGTAVHIDPGLGKTITALTAIVEWFKWGICRKPVLVIAPIKVCETVWRQEARDWSHTQHLIFQLIRGDEKKRAFALARPAHVVLINPELLKWLQKYIRADWGAHFDALVIDESSMFKDNRSQRFRVLTNYGTRQTVKGPDGKPWENPLTGMRELIGPHRFKRSAVLTGTPSPSGLQNLWSPFYVIDHGARLNKKFDTFQGRFFHKVAEVAPHIDKYALNAEEDLLRPEWETKGGGAERIHELISDITIELNAEDYGVLPQVLPPFKHYIDLPEELKPHYRQLEREAVFEMLENPVTAANGGAKSNLCWQICNGAVYTTDEYGRKEWKEVHTRKLDKLVEVIDELDQHALIPYHFNHDLERIVTRFKKEGIPYAVLKGKNTEAIIDRWNAGGIPNLLIHPQSAGHGLNLQFGGHTLIWFSTIWSLERYLQTNARVARSGQKGIVGIHVIMAKHTTDEVRYNSWFQNGDDMSRFRKATLDYQKQLGLDLMAIPEIGNNSFDWGGIKL
jgi:SNF2 family DNA or RNA helicase